MLRNRGFKLLLITMSVGLCIGTVVGFLVRPLAGVVVLLSGSVLCGCSILFTIQRYKDIEKLSGYLRKIYSGYYSMDIRDNVEGELSILKSEIYKVTSILSKQAELLKSEKEQLADAISDISHQLKTPLTSMMVMTDLLNKENLDPDKRREFTKNLELQLERMEWLLTSLLKLAKLDAGTVSFKREVIDVYDLMQQVQKPLLIPIELKEQKLVICGEAGVSFIGDRNWTVEALINIIKNCVEHTQAGGEITVSFEENPIYTEILIKDNGAGIDKEDIPFIFKRFYKVKIPEKTVSVSGLHWQGVL
jgi:signal transduction histidine kinase